MHWRAPLLVVCLVPAPAIAEPVSDELELDCPEIGPASPEQGVSGIAWNGTSFVALWSGARPGPDTDLFAARVAPDGTVLDPFAIPVALGPGNQGGWIAASTDGEVVVAWRDDRAYPPELRIARIAADGTVLDPGGVVVTTGNFNAPAIARAGDSLLLVWDDTVAGEVLALRLGADLIPLDTAPIVVATGLVGYPAVASDGDDFLVVWQRASPDWDIEALRISAAGVALDAAPIHLTDRIGQDESPSVAYGAGAYLVAWSARNLNDYESANIRGGRVSTAGAVLDPGGVPIAVAPAEQSWPAVSHLGDSWYVTWMSGNGPHEVEGILLDANAQQVGASLVLGRGTLPSVATDGAQFLVAWSQDDGDAVRVAADGAPIDTTPLVIARSADSERRPAAAFLGATPFVVWEERTGVVGGRLAPDGMILDPTGLPLAPSGRAPAAASLGDGALLVWEQPGATAWDVLATRIGPDGARVDVADLVVAGSGAREAEPDIACGDDQCLVVWGILEDLSEVSVIRDVRAARVDTDGVILDPVGLDVAFMDAGWSPPRVARATDRYLVVWQGSLGVGAALVVAATGEVVPFAFGALGWYPDVASRDDRFLVVWEDGASVMSEVVDQAGVGSGSVILAAGSAPRVARYQDGFVATWIDPDGSLRGGRVDTTGAPLDPGGFPIAARGDASLATSPGGATLVAYERFEPAAPYASSRVFARWIGDPLPDPGGECNTTFPADAGTPTDAAGGSGSDGGSGCGCRVARPSRGPDGQGAFILAAALAMVLRRRVRADSGGRSG